MNFPTEIFRDVMVVHAPDELPKGLLQEFLGNQDRTNVVLDLDQSESLDGEGLTEILDALDALRLRSGDLRIATSIPVNRKILEITRLDQQLETYDNVTDAVKSFDDR